MDSFWHISEFFRTSGGAQYGRSRRKQTFVPMVVTYLAKYGWSTKYVRNAMAHISDKDTEDWHPSIFAKAWIKWRIHNSNASSIEGMLLDTGLVGTNSAYVTNSVCYPLLEYYTDKQLASVAIEHIFASPMTPINTTHPFQPHKINTWFAHNILSMNVPYACNSNKRDLVVTMLEAQFRPTNIQNNLYFHATSWNYAQNIINGIQSGFGRRCLDFGYNPSFYISNSLQLALEFGQKSQQRHFQEIAILVFLLPQTVPSNIRYKELTGAEWVSITQKSRLCGSHEGELPELATIDLVGGDMVYNVRQVAAGEMPITHTPPKYQLASKKARGDLFLQDCLVGCIYFQKYIPVFSRRVHTRKHTRSKP